MRLFLCKETALRYWQSAWSDGVDFDAPSTVKSLRYAANSALDFKELADGQAWLQDSRAHVLVPAASFRCDSVSHVSHVWSGSIAPGSFYEIGKNVFVSSPEFVFLQMASNLSQIDLVKLGYELCSSYRIDAVDLRGFCHVDPRTDTARLAKYIAKMPGSKGVKAARQALRCIANESASPMETALAMLLCMPKRYGGYGFPVPIMNQRIDLAKDAEDMTGKQYFKCDLLWPDYKVAIEYDSDMFHTGSEKISEDAVRRNILGYLGVNVITVTRNQIMSAEKLSHLARQLAKAMGKRGISKEPNAIDVAALRRCLFSSDY